MDRKDIKNELKRIVPCTDYLQKGPHGGYICPFCGSGTKDNKTPALRYYPETNTVYCFSCQRSGDPLDLYGIQHGTDYSATLSLMAKQYLNIETPSGAPERPQTAFKGKGDRMSDKSTETATEDARGLKTQIVDYTAYFNSLRGNLRKYPEAAAYIEGRGIPVDLAEKYGVLYDPDADPANAPGGMGVKRYPTGRIILPSNKRHYATRAIDPDVAEQFQKLNAKDSKPGITNGAAIYNDDGKPVFITESMFNMLSVIAAGGAAVALNSAENWKTLADGLKKKPTDNVLIISLDNDPAGRKAAEALDRALKDSKTKHIIYNISGAENDANDLYRKDPAALAAAVSSAKRQAAKVTDGPFRICTVTDYLTDGGFRNDIEYFRKYRHRKTGFSNIDKHLTLYPGLAALGGAASLGKTTFAINLCDNLTDQGETVLYFTLEQEPIELVTKILARRLSMKDPGGYIHNLDIKNGATNSELEDIKKEYRETRADRFVIIRGNFSITAKGIRDQVEQFIEKTGIRPVVVIDYLQLVAQPDNFKGDTRAAVDENIKIFKAMQTDNELLVILVSNFNRNGYDKPVTYSDFKETGMIEYTCDYIWGLQLAVLDDPEFYTNTGTNGGKYATNEYEKSEMLDAAINGDKYKKEVEFVSLKSRNGRQSYKCKFNYYMQDDLYEAKDDPLDIPDREPPDIDPDDYCLPIDDQLEFNFDDDITPFD